MPFGYLVLVVLTALSVYTATAVVVRVGIEGRPERLVAMAMIWNGLLVAPIYCLGLTHLLYRGVLAAVSVSWFCAVLAVVFRNQAKRPLARAIHEALLDVLALPRDALLECLKRGNLLVLVAVFLGIGLATWAAVTTWYAPSWGQWDALWYHEPMIGWAIQNHGFQMVDLPMSAQKANGYPRVIEMTQLWFVVFTDRRLLELTNSIFAPVLAVATYASCRRYTRDKVAAMGWGAALLVSPVVSILLQTMYVDIHYAAFLVAATYFATRPDFRIRDAWLTSLCLALAIGSKSMALVPVPIIGVIAAARLIVAHGRTQRRATIAAIGGGMVAIGGMAATTYLRNYLAFHNPLWPDVQVDIPSLGIHWPGFAPMYAKGGGTTIDMNLPLTTLTRDLLAIPYSKSGSYIYQLFDYGFHVPYVMVPLATLSFVGALLTFGHRAFRRRRGVPVASRGETSWNVLLVGFVALAMLVTSPALWSARYNIACVSLLSILCSWLGGLRRFTRLGHSAPTVAAVSAVIMCSWVVPRWYWYPRELYALAKIPYPEREVTPVAKVAPDLFLARGSAITTKAGLARERELGPGSVLLFSENYGNYLGLFWNNKYTNRVLYAPHAKLLQEAERLNATWIFLPNGDGLAAELRNRGWQEIGVFNVESWGTVYRRPL